MISAQTGYDLRGLCAYQIIERIPRSRSYQVTGDGLTLALLLTHLGPAIPHPGLAQLTGPGPPARRHPVAPGDVRATS